MWTLENRPKYNRDHLRYPSDLTDDEWACIEPLIPPAKPGGGKRRTDMRAVMNGVMYLLSTGCQLALPTEGFSAVQHGPPLLRVVAVRWCAGSHSSHALRGMPRKGSTRSQPYRCHHR
jgi:transposase